MGIISSLLHRRKKGRELKNQEELESFDDLKEYDEISFVPVVEESEKKNSSGSTGWKEAKRMNSKREFLTYVKESSEVIAESDRRVEEAKIEYQAVTSYLTDMQKIDMIPKEDREVIEDAARKIINLTKERNKFQNKESKIKDSQYRLFERYEFEIPKQLHQIKESVLYQELIEKDRKHLEKEKKNLLAEQQEFIAKQEFLKGIAMTTCIIVLVLFLIFAVITNYYKANLLLPFLLTVLMGMGSAFYIFTESRKNRYANSVLDKKLNKVVALINKTSIKSINNRSYIEYSFNKYAVSSYEELKTLWDEFVKIKDETKRYQNNTELLNFYQKELIKELKKYGIADSEIWIYQTDAILDSREMVEIRHRLNVRRQKLREQIDTLANQKEDAIQLLNYHLLDNPEFKEEALQVIEKYRIQL